MVLERILKNFGYNYDVAYNGKVGLDKVLKKQNLKHCKCFYNLILMDC